MACLDPMLGAPAPEAPSWTLYPWFTPLEQAAVRIDASDLMGSLDRHPRWARLVRLVFGIAPATGLSDTRLEALRRLVVELRHSPAGRGAALVEVAVAAGVPPGQAAALARRFGGRRGSSAWW